MPRPRVARPVRVDRVGRAVAEIHVAGGREHDRPDAQAAHATAAPVREDLEPVPAASPRRLRLDLEPAE